MQKPGKVLAAGFADRVIAAVHRRRCCERRSEGRRAAYEMLVADLKVVARIIKHRSNSRDLAPRVHYAAPTVRRSQKGEV